MVEVGYLNLCGVCHRDFASVKAFDMHRVGRHAYTFNEGWEMDPPVEDGRRCLGADEYEGRGLVRDGRGRWAHGPSVEAARSYWSEAA